MLKEREILEKKKKKVKIGSFVCLRVDGRKKDEMKEDEHKKEEKVSEACKEGHLLTFQILVDIVSYLFVAESDFLAKKEN